MTDFVTSSFPTPVSYACVSPFLTIFFEPAGGSAQYLSTSWGFRTFDILPLMRFASAVPACNISFVRHREAPLGLPGNFWVSAPWRNIQRPEEEMLADLVYFSNPRLTSDVASGTLKRIDVQRISSIAIKADATFVFKEGQQPSSIVPGRQRHAGRQYAIDCGLMGLQGWDPMMRTRTQAEQ